MIVKNMKWIARMCQVQEGVAHQPITAIDQSDIPTDKILPTPCIKRIWNDMECKNASSARDCCSPAIKWRKCIGSAPRYSALLFSQSWVTPMHSSQQPLVSELHLKFLEAIILTREIFRMFRIRDILRQTEAVDLLRWERDGSLICIFALLRIVRLNCASPLWIAETQLCIHPFW